jgi:hypothetical protein
MRLHPLDQCVYCGSRHTLKPIILKSTYARAMRCIDTITCIRRRHETT